MARGDVDDEDRMHSDDFDGGDDDDLLDEEGDEECADDVVSSNDEWGTKHPSTGGISNIVQWSTAECDYIAKFMIDDDTNIFAIRNACFAKIMKDKRARAIFHPTHITSISSIIPGWRKVRKDPYKYLKND